MILSKGHKNSIAISVIMSIYCEPEAWLRESIDSILNQTFTDFEFIIINDNPDREINKKVLTEYAIRDKRIVLIKNIKNIGLTKSLNIGLKTAKGKFIARMDADDISLQNRFQKQLTFLNSNQEYVACGTFSSIINENGNIKGTYKIPTTHEDILNKFAYHNPVIHPTLMIRHEVLTTNKILFNENLRYAQDYDFIGKLLMVGKLANIPEKLVYYRLSSTQISNKNRLEQSSCAASVRIDFIIRNKHLFPFTVSKEDFRSKNTLSRHVINLERIDNANSGSFYKYVSLSLMTNFNAVNFQLMLLVVKGKKYDIKDKLKVIRAFIQEYLRR